nr:hypothetical protein [Tanacetum cinerariifolium]
MDQQYPMVAKIPVLDTRKFEQWQFQIQQYLQHEHYALWEVIEFEDSYVVPKSSPSTTTTDTTSGETGTKSRRTVTLTAEDMQRKKNDVKDDLNQKFLTSLAPEWLMRTIVRRNRSDLDTISLDNLYNHLKVYESEVQKKSEPNSHNMSFISSAKHGSRNEDGNTVCVPTASTNVPTASASVATISQDTACSYIASQYSGSQIKFEDINQIDEDNMEEMDIKWNTTLLSMRADKFWKKTRKKISIQGSDVVGFDNSKVKCFNCHKMGHFVRECGAPRSQDKGRRDNYRHGSKAEEQAPKALMAIDRVGWDWSYMENDEEDHALVVDEVVPIEFALMAKTSAESKVFDNSLCSKYCKKNNDSLNKFHNESKNKSIEILKKKLETLKLEKDGVDGKLAGLLKASKDLDNLIESQRSDKIKDGLGYNAVPPPTQLYLSPKKDLSWTGLPEYADDIITDYSRPSPTVESASGDDQNRNPSVFETVASPITPKPFIKFVKPKDSQSKSKTGKTESPKKPPVKYAEQYRKPNKKPSVRRNQRNWNNLKSHQLGPDFVMKKKACFNCGDFNHLAYDCRKRVRKTITPKPVAHRPYRPSQRLVRTNMNGASLNRTSFNKQAHSYGNRPFHKTSAVRSPYRPSWVPTVNSTKSPTTDMGMKGKAVNPSACWFWKPSPNLSNKGSKNNSVSVMFKKYTYIDTQVLGRGFKLLDDANIFLRTPRRLGHLNFKTMNKLVRHNLVRGLPTKCFENDHNCTACLKGKQHKASLPDDFSRFTWTFFLKSKDETSGILKKFITKLENLKDLKVKIISKAFRVFNKRTRRVEENLHVEFLENKAIEKGSGPKLLFDIDSLTKSMNYMPVDAGTISTNLSGTKDAARQEVKKDLSFLRYIALLNWAHDALLEFSTSKPQDHCSIEVPEGSGNLNPTASTSNPLADQMETLTVETPIPTVIYQVANQEETPSLDNILLLTNRFEDILRGTTNLDESNGEEADISNMKTAIIASPTPTLKIHKDHPKSQIIGPMDTPIQTRNKSKEIFDALQDLSWVEAMQEELLPFKIQNIWTLVDCPKGEEGIDYNEVFAHVARIKAIRLFLAYASFIGFTVYQMDVKSVFLYGTIDEKVGTIDQTLFIRKKREDFILVQVYVDDIIFGSSNPHLCREFEALMHEKFQMSAMGKLNFFLGLQVLQKEDGIFLSQDKCVGDILKKFGYSDVRHQVTPKECHLHAFKRIFRYLKGYPKLGLWSLTESPFDLVAYSDSDYGVPIPPFINLKPYYTSNTIMERLQFYDYHNMVAILEKSEYNADFHPMVDFIEHPLSVPFHTRKLFTTLRVNSPSSSGRIVPLFDTMLVHQGEGSGIPTKSHHTPSPEALSPSHTTHTLPTLPPVTTTSILTVTPTDTPIIRQYTKRTRIAQSSIPPIVADEPASPLRDVSQGEACPTDSGFIADQDRATIAKSSTCPMIQHHGLLPLLLMRAEVEINRLKERVKLLEEREGLAAKSSGDDAPIKGRSMDEGEVATKRISDDLEEIATVLTLMDAATVLASGMIDVPTGSGSIPTASTPAEGSVPTGSEEVPTASPFFATATVVTPVTRRKGKKVMEYHQFSLELPIERIVELISDLVKYQDNYTKIYKFQSQQRKPWSKKQKRDYYMAMEDFIPVGSKEEAERIKRKGLNLEQESAKKQKTSEEVLEKAMSLEEVTEEKSPVKETLSNRPPTSEKEMELWVELNMMYEPDKEDQLWTYTQNFMCASVDWKLYDSCGVHHVTSKDK